MKLRSTMNQLAQRRMRGRRGFSLMELLIVVAIIMILAAVAIPRYNAFKMNTQEVNAIRQIDTIHQAQTQYMSQFGRFATTLLELGPPQGGATGPSAADLIPGDLAKGDKTGYRFQVQGNEAGYVVLAAPIAFSQTGRRTFYSDQTMVKRENWGKEQATAQSPEVK